MDNDEYSPASTGFESLFIQEEDGPQQRAGADEIIKFDHQAQPALPEIDPGSQPQARIHPYLREMDEWLRSCEELTGSALSSQFSPRYTDTSLSDAQLENSDCSVEGYRETSAFSQVSSSTTYIDTRVEVSDTGQLTQADQEASSATISSSSRETAVELSQAELPLTSAGNAISDTMTEYQSQLMGILAMLDSSMDDSGLDLGHGMALETQGCFIPDTNNEYIQISSQRRNEHTATENRTAVISEVSTFESLGGPHTEPGTKEGQHWFSTPGEPVFRHVEKETTTVQTQEHSGPKSESSDQDHRLHFSIPKSATAIEAQHGLSSSEATQLQDIREVKGSPARGHDAKLDITHLCDGGREGMDMANQSSSTEELATVGCQMEKYIKEVEGLHERRTAMLEEVLGLRRRREEQGDTDGETAEQEDTVETEDTIDRKAVALLEELRKEEEERREQGQREVLAVRAERARVEGTVWRISMERQGLQAETWRLKRRLFTEARSCAQSLAALNSQQRAVERFKMEEETLQALVLKLTEERSRLGSAHRERLSTLQAALRAQSSRQTHKTVQELTECRRHSCGDVQKFLQGGLKDLEERYEPMLTTLLKRRETTASAITKAREQLQELRGQLRPLGEECNRMEVQKVCLEERLKLMQTQRQEDIQQYKTTVRSLEESICQMQAELTIQERKTKETEDMKENLANKLLLYRAAVEDRKKT